jgi:hypothetical protein
VLEVVGVEVGVAKGVGVGVGLGVERGVGVGVGKLLVTITTFGEGVGDGVNFGVGDGEAVPPTIITRGRVGVGDGVTVWAKLEIAETTAIRKLRANLFFIETSLGNNRRREDSKPMSIRHRTFLPCAFIDSLKT